MAHKHWQFSTDADNIGWLTLDRQQSAVNSLDSAVLAELAEILTDIMQQQPLGVVITSAKANGFIAGADITQFTKVQTLADALTLMQQAQAVLAQLADLTMPTVAVIQGFCLGGGLELALACSYRIAVDVATTSLGLPEVHLGLHPGWGGTIRLPRLIGVYHAMQMMLLGRSIDAKQALAWGVVDAVLPLSAALGQAKQLIRQKPVLKRVKGWQGYHKSNKLRFWLSCQFYYWLRRRVDKRHYPAAYLIVDNWRQDGAQGAKAFANEAKSIACLMMTHTGQQLIRLFLLRSKLKSIAKGAQRRLAHLHVIGCGALGGRLAILAAIHGLKVTLQDSNSNVLATIYPRLRQELLATNSSLEQLDIFRERLIIDPQGEQGRDADVCIEAVSEDLACKQKVLAEFHKRQQQQALLLTTTTTLPITEIAQGLPDSVPLLALHLIPAFANCEVMEIIAPQDFARKYIAETAALVIRLGSLPLSVNATPGYLLVRILLPYLFEAMYLLDEQMTVPDIDLAAQHFGMRIGPLALADSIGLDVCAKLAENHRMLQSFSLPKILQQKLTRGHWGCRVGQGFYRYPQSLLIDRVNVQPTAQMPTIILRLLPQFINAAVDALEIIDDADFLDAAMVYATGFPACQGGPLTYLHNYGVQHMIALLDKLDVQHGARYRPVAGWKTLLYSKES